MTSPAYDPPPPSSAFGPYAAPGGRAARHDGGWELSAGDRLGPAPRGRRAKWLRRLAVVAMALAGGVSWHAGLLPSWPAWMPADLASLTNAIDLRLFSTPPVTQPVQAAAPAPLPMTAFADKPDALPPPEPETAGRAPGEAAPPPQAKGAPITTASLPPPAAPAGDINAPAPPGDPLRAKAEGAGLHPDLSRVLLLKLSEADYRNAALAIRKALAESAATAIVVHPRKRQADLAQFKVHFVTGAAPTCRRYVVAIAKDGWLTTALPVEKCGTVPTVKG